MVPVRYFVVKHKERWAVEFENTLNNGFTHQKEAADYAISEARKAAQGGKHVEVLVQSEKKVWYTVWTDGDL